MSSEEWKNDWSVFVRTVVSDLDIGLSEIEFSKKYSNQDVVWFGVVSSAELEHEDAFVRIDMPPIQVSLASGASGIVNYLCLVVSKAHVEKWRAISTGDEVQFRTRIRKANGPFSGLNWTDIGGRKGYISVATEEAELIHILK